MVFGKMGHFHNINSTNLGMRCTSTFERLYLLLQRFQFSLEKSFAFLFSFIPRYFIFFESIVSESVVYGLVLCIFVVGI